MTRAKKVKNPINSQKLSEILSNFAECGLGKLKIKLGMIELCYNYNDTSNNMKYHRFCILVNKLYFAGFFVD